MLAVVRNVLLMTVPSFCGGPTPDELEELDKYSVRPVGPHEVLPLA
jgi:hypothetical protein